MIDKFSLKILRYIKKNADITLEQLKSKFGDHVSDTLTSLEKQGFIINPTIKVFPTSNGFAKNKANKYKISPEGKSHLEERKDTIIRYWIPIFISLISIVISIISLIRTF